MKFGLKFALTDEGRPKLGQNAHKHGMRSSENQAVEALMAFYGQRERAARLEIKNC